MNKLSRKLLWLAPKQYVFHCCTELPSMVTVAPNVTTYKLYCVLLLYCCMWVFILYFYLFFHFSKMFMNPLPNFWSRMSSMATMQQCLLMVQQVGNCSLYMFHFALLIVPRLLCFSCEAVWSRNGFTLHFILPINPALNEHHIFHLGWSQKALKVTV